MSQKDLPLKALVETVPCMIDFCTWSTTLPPWHEPSYWEKTAQTAQRTAATEEAMSAPSRISCISSQQPKAPAPSMLSAAAFSARSPGASRDSREPIMQPAMESSTFQANQPTIEVLTAIRARVMSIDPSSTTELSTLSPSMVNRSCRGREHMLHDSQVTRIRIWV